MNKNEEKKVEANELNEENLNEVSGGLTRKFHRGVIPGKENNGPKLKGIKTITSIIMSQ